MKKQPPAKRDKAFSYIRFSTPEQAEGDSLRRQTDKARQYASANNLDLDETLTFRDLGMSAHHGRNAEDGALGAFLNYVNDGRVPQGSYLLVESLDRISRQTVRKAVRTLENIAEAGVTVVDLSDNGRVYSVETLDNDQFAFVMMALRFIRAHEESATKGTRVAAAFEQKRKLAASKATADRPFTRMLPAWLRWNDTRKRYEAIPERAKIVRDIFRKANNGEGQHAIAHSLNESGVEPWGGGKSKAAYWHRSYVRKLLTNRAVIGTFTPHKATKDHLGKRVRKPLDAIVGYWPAVVEPELFERVNLRMSVTAARGRNAGGRPMSIFAGVLKCAYCDGSFVRVSKGAHVYLACSQAHAKAGCKYQAVPYRAVENALTVNAQAIFEDAPRGSDTTALEKDAATQESRVSALVEASEHLVNELVGNNSDAVRRRLHATEVELEAAQERLRRFRERIETQAPEYVKRRLATLRECLKQKPIDIAKANKALKEAVRRIVVDPEAGTLAIHWHHSDAATRGPVFASRHSTSFRTAESVEGVTPKRANVSRGQGRGERKR